MTTALQETGLPVLEVAEDLRRALSQRDEVVLEAPPGAGKTTLVPLLLLDCDWLGGARILMLEARPWAIGCGWRPGSLHRPVSR